MYRRRETPVFGAGFDIVTVNRMYKKIMDADISKITFMLIYRCQPQSVLI